MCVKSFGLELKVTVLDLETNVLVCVLNEIDAKKLGVAHDDRVILTNPTNTKFVAAVVDVAKKIINHGEIGITSEAKTELDLVPGSMLEVTRADKPQSFSYIKKKILGQNLTFDEIKQIVDDIKHNRLSSIELTAFVTAVKINGYSLDETYAMARNIADNGKSLKLNVDGIIVDKHSIGGINGRATMIVVPIIANFDGLFMPKTSSRAITSAAGTADSMEVLADVCLNSERLQNVVEKTNASIVWGGSFDFAPVDDKIIRIERPLQLDPEGQVIASVLSKKVSVGAKKVIIDVPMGKDMKAKTLPDAERIATNFVGVGKKLGIDIRAVITNASIPCGNTFGPALEAKSVLETLEGKVNDTLTEKACELAGQLLELCGTVERGQGANKAKQILRSGKALRKMKQIIEVQGKKIDSSKDVVLGEYFEDVVALKSGHIEAISISDFTNVALASGCPFDKGAGILLMQKTLDGVEKDTHLFRIYTENKNKLQSALALAKRIEPVKIEEMIIEEIS